MNKFKVTQTDFATAGCKMFRDSKFDKLHGYTEGNPCNRCSHAGICQVRMKLFYESRQIADGINRLASKFNHKENVHGTQGNQIKGRGKNKSDK